MRKENGFTLIELLATIALLAVVATIIIYNTIGLNNSSKDLQYERMIENIKNASQTYVSLYPENFSDLYSSKAFTYITIQELIDAGLIDADTTNPYTNELIDPTEEVKVYVDGASLEMTYIYPVTDEDRNTEIWLTSATLSVNVDEGFSIFDGLGTTSLSLANEDGTLINDAASEGFSNVTAFYKDKYHFTAEIQNAGTAFTNCENTSTITDTVSCLGKNINTAIKIKFQKGTTYSDYYIARTAGTYKIIYSWYNPNDTKAVKHQASRTIRVIDTSSAAATEAIKKGGTDASKTKEDDEDETTDSALIYTLPDSEKTDGKVIFTGSNYIDTGVKLFSSDHDWTMILVGRTTGKTSDVEDYSQFVHCMEEKSPYTGITVRVQGDHCNGYKCIGWASNRNVEYQEMKSPATSFSKFFKLILTRDISKGKNQIFWKYCSDADDSTTCTLGAAGDAIIYSYSSIGRSLILGAMQDTSNNYSRFLIGEIKQFDLYYDARYDG